MSAVLLFMAGFWAGVFFGFAVAWILIQADDQDDGQHP
jgi:hypothetical protein